MADVTTTSDELKIKMYFVDGDDRILTLKNPAATVTADTMSALNTWMQINQPVIGDKMGAAFGKIITATKISKQSAELDIDT